MLGDLIVEHRTNISAWRDNDRPFNEWDTFSWSFNTTHPGNQMGDHDIPVDELGPYSQISRTLIPHFVTILSRWPSWHDIEDRLQYRGACLGCMWVCDENHGRENDAVECAHDHGWSGWRDLPLIERAGLQAGSVAKGAKELYEELYLVKLWPDRRQLYGAPMLTQRTGIGTRHVPAVNPWGGYDLCGAVKDEPDRTSVSGQDSLF